jgi:hypothetical protein
MVMFNARAVVAATFSTAVIAGATSPAANAQSPDTGVSTPKQIQKAQRKADRKAARAKNSAELKSLEKNGYQPGDDQINYPQNIQDAEKKAAKGKPASTP